MLVPIADAAEWFPLRGGKRLSAKAVRRRIHKGSKGVRLEAVRDGGEWFTCREWVERYLSDVTAASLAKRPVPFVASLPKTPERVKKRLARRYGIHAAK